MIYGMNDDLHKQLEGSGDIEAKEHDVTARKWRRFFHFIDNLCCAGDSCA